MRKTPDVWQVAARIVPRLATMVLLITMAAVALPEPAVAQPPAAQGIQSGGLDLNDLDPVTGTCRRLPEVDLLLNDPAMLARTSWVRINIRAAGGMYPGNPNAVIACPDTLDAAYEAILNDFANRAPWIQVIGLMTQDLWWGSYDRWRWEYDAQGFADAAGRVACRAAYRHVDVWEIWNEPDLDNEFGAYLAPGLYAAVLGGASREIRDCGNGDLVISAGLLPDFPTNETADGLLDYLRTVDENIRFHHYGGYDFGLADAVDGIGIHPYVPAINLGDSGHAYLNNFLSQVAGEFGKPLYITEFGWQIIEGMDQARQCRNLVSAFQVINNWAGTGSDRVAAATWFTLQDFGDPERNFGLYDVYGNVRLAYTGYTSGACGPPPAGPSHPTATALSGTGIQVRWSDNSTDETGFQIDNGVTSVTVGANVTSYTWTGLSPGTYMCFRVRSFNPDGYSPVTTWACTTTMTVPASPSNPAAVAVNGTSIRVSWQDNAGNEAGFEVYNGVTSVYLAANTTGYTWSGLSPGTYMCFAVRAYNNAGSSALTPWACTTTTAPPAAPANPAAVAVTGTSIHVTWQDNSGNETGFRIYNGVSTVAVPANTTSYTWSGLSPGTYMCFAVYAYNSAGESAWTPWACTSTPTPPAVPANPGAVAINGSSIRVTWADNSSNESWFEIYNGVTSRYVGANVTSYTWSGLSPGTYMCFRVRAGNGAGSSVYTNWACTTTPTPPAAPSSPVAVAVNGTGISVTWRDNSSNETLFQIDNGVTSRYVGANVTGYTWSGLSPGTYMCFRIRAVNNAGYSPYTGWACTTTPTPPVTPSYPGAVAISGSSIRVTWADNSSNESWFEIYNGVTSRYVGANVTSYTWSGLSPGTYMCFRVRAGNGAGSSVYTNWACTTTY